MDHHTKATPKNKADMLLESVTGVAGDLDEFVDFSMIAQAEALKFGIEHFRRRKPHCSGTIVWQLNDCWPMLSWAWSTTTASARRPTTPCGARSRR